MTCSGRGLIVLLVVPLAGLASQSSLAGEFASPVRCGATSPGFFEAATMLELQPPRLDPDPADPVDSTPSTDESIPPAAPTLAQIPFQDVFVPATRLPDPRRARRPSLAQQVPLRDPYFGTERIRDFHWVPSNLAHKTLYFDDDPLERYGYTCAPLLQPAISLTEFYKDLLAAPIRSVFDPPGECHFVAGVPRVGDAACPLKERIVPVHR